MLKHRYFPRYNISKLNISVEITSNDGIQQGKKLRIIDISFSGIKISSAQKLELTKISNVDISLGKNNFNVKVGPIWEGLDEDNNHIVGLKVFFHKLDNYQRWLRFIKALDILVKAKHKSSEPLASTNNSV